MEIMRTIRDTTKKMDDAKRVVRGLFRTPPKLRFYFAYFYKYAKVHPNRILLESFNGKSVSDSAYAVLREMMDQGIAQDYDIYFATNNLKRDQPFVDKNHLPVTLVNINSRMYPYILATAKYLLGNVAFPAYFIRKPEQVYVQTWHGTPLKTLGKQMRMGMQSMFLGQHNFLQASWITFPNDFTRDAVMRDYNLEPLYTGKVAMVGFPRNAVFLKGQNRRLREAYDLDSYTTFAYMPTWRGTSSANVNTKAYIKQVDAILSKIDESLTDDQKMFVNFHTMVADKVSLGSYKHIVAFPKEENTYDFLAQMDVLITDYSSVLFDFALTKRPVVLFCYDKEEYLADRGMYFPMEELPFPIVETTDGLCGLLRRGNYATQEDDYAAFYERFLKYDSASNASVVLSMLLGDVPAGVPVIDYGHNAKRSWNVVDALPQSNNYDLDGLFLSSDKHEDLIVLERRTFGSGKSVHVCDLYRDYNYIFTTRATPLTLCEILERPFVRSVRERVAKREQDRLLGGGFNAKRVRTTYACAQAGTKYTRELDTPVPALVDVVNGHLLVAPLDDSLDYLAILITYGRRIRYARDLSQKEREARVAALDLSDLLCSPEYRASRMLRTRVALLARKGATEELCVVTLLPSEMDLEEHGARYLPPVTVPSGVCRARIEAAGFDHTSVPIVHNAAGRSISVSPYFDEAEGLSLFASYSSESMEACVRPVVSSATTPGEAFMRLHIRVDKGAYVIRGLEFEDRSNGGGTRFGVPYELVEYERFVVLKAWFYPRNNHFDELFWDLYLVVETPDGVRQRVHVSTTGLFRHSLYLRNLQCEAEEGCIVFPMATNTKTFSLCHRERTPYDVMLTRVKEWLAFGAYVLTRPYWKQRKIWLVYEKFCSTAQDNGYQFFRYCMDEAPGSAKDRVYYVLKRDAEDRAKTEGYRSNIIDFMSLRHMLYALGASMLVGSDARPHLYAWRPKPSIITKFIGKRPIFFLQHGVTAMKRVDYLFGKRGVTPMTYFLTTSAAEQEIVTQNFGYDQHHAPVLGFSRWDVLEDRSGSSSHPTILLMPTWRQWLEGVDDKTFVESEYFRSYAALLADERLHALLRASNMRVKFFMHPKFSEQMRLFEEGSDVVDIVPMGSTPLNELIMGCKALITDYSSVAWDMLYLNKPVLFFQFDQERYREEVGAYVDLNADLPGPVCTDVDSMLAELESMIAHGFELSDEARACADHWFDCRDKNNRKRTYDYIVGEGY